MSEFFEQLQVFSERVFELLGFKEKASPWRSRKFTGSGGRPMGAVLHFTAGSYILRVLRWFMVRKYNAQASAHVVVADGWPEEWIPLADGLDWVQALPAAVVQCVPPDQPAWHATWTNRMCYGIEMVNAGELRPDGRGGFTWWPNDWTEPWHAMGAVPKVPREMYGRFWEPYTCEQIAAVVEVLREVQAYHRSLKPSLVIGHENAVEDKWDPGPLFPIHGVRQAAFEPGVDPQAYQWFQGYARDAHYGEAWRQVVVQNYWAVESGEDVDRGVAWEAVSAKFQSDFLEYGEGGLGRLALQLLGYYAPPLGSKAWSDEQERYSIEVFQHMAGLRVDGIPGPITCRALVGRLENRGILT